MTVPLLIPYDPSLYIGSVITAEKQVALDRLAEHQAVLRDAKKLVETEAATLDAFDSMLLEASHSNPTTLNRVQRGRRAASQRVATATNALISARFDNARKSSELHAEVEAADGDYASPVAVRLCTMQRFPLMTESVRMAAQYFPFSGDNQQDPSKQSRSLASYVAGATRFLGSKRSRDLTQAVSSQVAEQRGTHAIAGTLIITATCTHKDVSVLDPLILDADKAVRLWNRLFADIALDIADPDGMVAAARSGASGGEAIRICSGASYGSSFVGMIHLLQRPEKLSGADSPMQLSAVSDVRRLIADDSSASHCSIVAGGAIPSMMSADPGISNAVLDVRSLLTAFDNYLQEVRQGSHGLPLQFLTTTFERDEVARIWCDRYRPGAFAARSESATPQPEN